jgi:hypothetical protein
LECHGKLTAKPRSYPVRHPHRRRRANLGGLLIVRRQAISYQLVFSNFFFFQYPRNWFQQAISNFIDIAMATTELCIPAGNT